MEVISLLDELACHPIGYLIWENTYKYNHNGVKPLEIGDTSSIDSPHNFINMRNLLTRIFLREEY